jgi:hypothetical protein
MSPAKQHWMIASSETVSSVARVVVRAVVVGLELDEEVLLLLDAAAMVATVALLMVVVLLAEYATSPATTSANMSPKSSSAI